MGRLVVSRATVSVIASGWSLRDLGDDGRARIPGFRIGVNDSCLRLVCETGLTMDRLFVENRWGALKQRNKRFLVRGSALRNIPARIRPSWLRSFDCDHETDQMTDIYATYNGRNSGACAVNAAYQMRPAKIILWGFDMCRSPEGDAYWHEAYPWSLNASGNTPSRTYADWSKSFTVIAEQCRRAGVSIVNASPVSVITAIEKVDPWSMLTQTT